MIVCGVGAARTEQLFVFGLSTASFERNASARTTLSSGAQILLAIRLVEVEVRRRNSAADRDNDSSSFMVFRLKCLGALAMEMAECSVEKM